MRSAIPLLLAAVCAPTPSSAADAKSAAAHLDQRLLSVPAKQLAADARKFGSATRGAILFHQPVLACTKCHSVGEDLSPRGPDLAVWKEKPTDVHIVEAVLQPAKSVRKGYEAITVVTDKGKTFNTNLIFTLELGFMLDCAETIAVGALERKESRGAHYRTDMPDRDDENWLKHTEVYRDGDDVRVETSDVTITKWEPIERVY